MSNTSGRIAIDNNHSLASSFAVASRVLLRSGASSSVKTATPRLRALFALFVATTLAVAGCGGGYPGLGLTKLSASAATIDASQSVTISASMTGNVPIVWAITTPTCSENGCGTLSATTGASIIYKAPASISAPFQVVVQAKVDGTSNAKLTTITVNPAPAIAGVPPSGTVGVVYTTTLTTSGGTGARTLSLGGGSLPPGLTFNAATGVISGNPTTAGAFTFVVQVVDSSDIPFTASATKTIVITNPGAALAILGGNPPSGTVGITYATALIASGGTQPYSWSILSGSLPPGLALSPTTGVISGTPTTQGTYTFTAQVQDAAGARAASAFSITINAGNGAGSNPIAITVGSLPDGTVNVPYSATIGVSGGTAPYSCAVASGSLPAGLSLGSNCQVSGTPAVAGTSTISVKATDNSNPAQSTTAPVTITIKAALAITTGSLPDGTVGTFYSSTIPVTGGTSPYTCALVSGSLPAGLTLNANCVVSGTPTTAGTATVTVKATDSNNPAATTTGQVTIKINPAPLAVTVGPLPGGTVGTPYSATIPVTGGTAPYSCSITSGTLPAGLALGANCLVSGTPTIAGTSNLTVRGTDAGNPAQTATGAVSITIVANPTLVITGPPSGTVNVPYDGPITVTGGTGPYTCALQSGTLQTGLTLGANCHITGTPTAGGTSTISVKATDSSTPANTSTTSVAVTINPGTTVITVGNPPTATVGTPYTGTIPITGGTGPYTCALITGTLPSGLTLGANCVITGTPTGSGSSPITVKVTDTANPPATTTAPVTVMVQPPLPLTLTGSLPNAVLNQPYTQTLHAAGGVAPYTYSITAGTLPAGLTLSSGGVISGTPSAPGATSFTVTATDAETPAQTASLPLVLLVVYPPTANDGLLNGPYAFLFQGYDDVALGLLAYQTATVGSFTANGTGVVSAGEQDTNHQGANPTGQTIAATGLLGTYTIGNDDRGSLTVTAINNDGTVGRTTTYAISVKAPVAPAVVAAQGSLIEFDGSGLAGTRGSGTFLAQNAGSFATGLTGNYAFGLQGDTPCLPACTVGIVAGPAAAVGQFTAGSGTIGNGAGDTNISSANYPTSALSGTYGIADANGRLQMSLTTSNMPLAVYPSDFAVYMVNANQVFVMSTDKHSSYILLAGSATSQTAGIFSNASLTGGYVGYENSPTNPGLVGATLQNVLNLSTATIFRGTANSSGTCTTTNVDVAGLTGLVNGLTGLGSGAPIINGLLGTYQSTGNSSCVVAANGRAVINYPVPDTILTATLGLLGITATPPKPRVAYLTSANSGYFLETGYAGLGNIEQQVGSPFTTATLKGTYVYGSTPAATLAGVNTSGVFTADGAGHANTTLDLNVGVGNLNVLQLGTSGNFNYTLTDATAGRFLLGTSTVVYAISPGRFVLLDTNALTTSPSVALIF